MDRRDLEPETIAEIDRIARAFVDDGKAPGLAYGIVRHGNILHAGGIGLTGIGLTGIGSGAPDAGSVFRIASMTKSFTAAATLLLRDEGALRLDEPVATYVPAAADLPRLTADAPELTLRLLLTMSAGFPTDDPWADRQESMSASAFAALLRAGPRFAEVPGTAFEYSNLGYAIIGRAVSNVAGQSFRQFVTNRLLRPLGMRSTHFSADDVPAEVLVRGHRPIGPDWQLEPFDRPGEFSPIGGLFSTVTDLAIWTTGFANAATRPIIVDDHPLCPASRREMQQLHRLSAVSTSTVDDVGHALARGYGMGLTREQHTHWGDVVGHSGGYPGFGSNMRWHPATGFVVIALANATYSGPSVVAAAMLEAVLRTVATRTAVPVPWPELASLRAAVDGLVAGWDDNVADRVFAMNMDLDEPRDQRRERTAAIVARLGVIDTAVVDTGRIRSAVDLDWTVTGSLGSAVISIGLSPEPHPKIQTLDIRFVAPEVEADAPPDVA